jgi:hypothetical protein
MTGRHADSRAEHIMHYYLATLDVDSKLLPALLFMCRDLGGNTELRGQVPEEWSALSTLRTL